jgi:hypothetical protein
MRTLLKRLSVIATIVFLAIQLIPIDRTNPTVTPTQSICAIEQVPPVPRAILQRACMDCHSNETHWPWYSHIAPVSWWMANDVHEARRKMNLSHWGDYSEKKRDHELEEICNELLDNEMPESTYTFMHHSASVTEDERAAVCEWTGSPR